MHCHMLLLSTWGVGFKLFESKLVFNVHIHWNFKKDSLF